MRAVTLCLLLPVLVAGCTEATRRECTNCPEMVAVSGGSFMMGSLLTEPGRVDDEGPQRRVTVQPFEIGKYEVTFGEWDACVAAGGCDGYRPADLGLGRGNRPANSVTWNHAKAYARWLSEKTGQAYRLPSEAEWEYAARAGTHTAWFWGDEQNKACQYANIADFTAQSKFEGKYRTIYACEDSALFSAPPGRYCANNFGLYDMIGSVREWVEDCRSMSYENAPSDGSPETGQTCDRRVERGGSWDDEPFKSRIAYRINDWSGNRNDVTGFRVARTL